MKKVVRISNVSRLNLQTKGKILKDRKSDLEMKGTRYLPKTNPIKHSRVLTKAKTSLRPRKHRTSEKSSMMVGAYIHTKWMDIFMQLVASSVTVQW